MLIYYLVVNNNMDTKGFVDTLKHYGSNGCDVVGNGTTTTIVGSVGSIVLEKRRGPEYTMSIRDALDTACVGIEITKPEELPDLNDYTDVHNQFFRNMGKEKYHEIFDDRNDPRDEFITGLRDHCIEVSNGHYSADINYCSRGKLATGKVTNRLTKIEKLTSSEFTIYGLPKYKPSDKTSELLLIDGTDEDLNTTVCGFVRHGSRLVPITKALIMESCERDYNGKPNIFKTIGIVKELTNSEIKTRFSGAIDNNRKMFDRAKHVIKCLNGVRLHERLPYVEINTKNYDTVCTGSIDFGCKLQHPDLLDVIQSSANILGYEVDTRHIFNSSLYGGIKHIATDIIVKEHPDAKSCITFYAQKGNTCKFESNKSKYFVDIEDFIFVMKEEAERLKFDYLIDSIIPDKTDLVQSVDHVAETA
jgi:hypothetical protein